MKLSAYEIALIAGGFTIIGALLGAWIGYKFSISLAKINARSIAVGELRASFASQLAYLRGYEGSAQDTETIRDKFYADLLAIHAAELQRFRFYVKAKDI